MILIIIKFGEGLLSISARIIYSFKKLYQILKRVFHLIFKHVEVGLKNLAFSLKSLQSFPRSGSRL